MDKGSTVNVQIELIATPTLLHLKRRNLKRRNVVVLGKTTGIYLVHLIVLYTSIY